MSKNNVNKKSSGQQHSIPGLQVAFTPGGANDFPSFGDEGSKNQAANSQQQMSLGSITKLAYESPDENDEEFNQIQSQEHFEPGDAIPKEEFPDLDQAFGAP